MADAAQKEKIKEQFKKLDKDNTGQLEQKEVRNALKELYSSIDLRLSDADLNHLIKSADKNGDGKINIDEFIQLL